MPRSAPRVGGLVFSLLAAACGGRSSYSAALPALPFPADTNTTEALRRGVIHRYIYSSTGPWAIHVLEVDLDRCYRGLALKGAAGAIGREKTSVLLRQLQQTGEVSGGVNADFFLFAPPGVPTGAMISRGRVVTGPSSQPVLAFDSAGAPHIITLRTRGSATIAGRRFEIAGWNRSVPDGLALFDAAWAPALDTASSAIEVVLRGNLFQQVVLVDTTTSGAAVPGDGSVLLARRDAPADLRAALGALRPGDTVRVERSLEPMHPWEAVGGRPVLVRDSAVTGAVDTEGQPGFATGRHPRTAVGIARSGKRLILVVVDGRQKPYSDGMSLRELANLMLALGAREAINLDGGGSSTFVVAGSTARDSLRIANRPSDPAGERPVGNALAILEGCGGKGNGEPGTGKR